MGWNELRGHTDRIEMFRRTISRGRLGQAYLLIGPAGSGKKLFASILARSLFCRTNPPSALDPCDHCSACKQLLAGTHPDFSLVERLAGKKDLLIEQFIGSRENRGKEGLCHELALKPMSADRKIAVIDDADFLKDEGANALLKTLEEPPHGSLIILIAANVDRLLPTIRSRCQEIRFTPLPDSEIAELMIENGMVDSSDEASEIAAICGGSLATAAQLSDADLRAQRKELYRSLAAGDFHSVQTAEKVIACIEEVGSEAALQRQRAAWFVHFCVEFYRELLEVAAGKSRREESDISPPAAGFFDRMDPADPEGVEMIAALMDRAVTAQGQLDRSMSVGLCIEALFHDLSRIVRHGVPV